MLKKLISSDTIFIMQLLSVYEMLTIKELENLTGYWEMYIYLALGWLSKEDKIRYKETDKGLCIELNKMSK